LRWNPRMRRPPSTSHEGVAGVVGGAGEGATVGAGGGDGAGTGVAFEAPASVDELVVTAAQQHAVDEVGEAAFLPGSEVVGVAPAGRAVAAGEDAAAVPVDQGATLGSGEEALAAAQVDDLAAVGVADDLADPARAEQDGGEGCAGGGA